MVKKRLLEPFDRKKEESVKRLWKKENLPELVRKASQKQEKPYYFMDGPPYATGHIHMGTALNKILKDATIDQIINATDIIELVTYVFKSGPPPVPEALGEVDGIEPINASDIIYLVTYVFKSGPPPVVP